MEHILTASPNLLDKAGLAGFKGDPHGYIISSFMPTSVLCVMMERLREDMLSVMVSVTHQFG